MIEANFDTNPIEWHTDEFVGTAEADQFKTWIINNKKNVFLNEKQKADQSDIEQKEYKMSYEQILENKELRESFLLEYLKENGHA